MSLLIYNTQKTSLTSKLLCLRQKRIVCNHLAFSASIAAIKSAFFIADIFGIPIAFAIYLRLATVYEDKSVILANISLTLSLLTFSSFSQAFLAPPVDALAGAAALESSLVIFTSYSFSLAGNDFSYSFNHS